jgi:hypothetical protein
MNATWDEHVRRKRRWRQADPPGVGVRDVKINEAATAMSASFSRVSFRVTLESRLDHAGSTCADGAAEDVYWVGA